MRKASVSPGAWNTDTAARTLLFSREPAPPDGHDLLAGAAEQDRKEALPIEGAGTTGTVGAYSQRERHAQSMEDDGSISFQYIENDGDPNNLMRWGSETTHLSSPISQSLPGLHVHATPLELLKLYQQFSVDCIYIWKC